MDDPDALASVDNTVGTRLIYERIHLHVHNHTTRLGRGYHFDALIPSPVPHAVLEPGDSRARSRSPVRHSSATQGAAASSHASAAGAASQPSCPRHPAVSISKKKGGQARGG